MTGASDDTRAPAELTLDRVTKVFADGTVALSDVVVEAVAGEFLVVVGPSGCGKSTVLRIVAGLEQPTEGDVLVDGRSVLALEPKDRDVAMVFQTYALYPHMTVRKNIASGLRSRRLKRAEVEARVSAVAERLELTPVLRRKPSELSGGQRQRVALGRAIVREPQLFLMDEPLSNVDAQLRVQMRRMLLGMHQALGTTFVYVTHDQVEAMTMADQLVVLQAGRVRQTGSPGAVYARPADTFVAGFLGSPPMNLVRMKVGSHRLLAADGGDFAISLAHVPERSVIAEGDEVIVGFRAEHLAIGRQDGEAWSTARARVELVESLGAEGVVHVAAGRHEVSVRVSGRGPFPGPGDVIDLAVDGREVHLFDAVTGTSLREVKPFSPTEGGP